MRKIKNAVFTEDKKLIITMIAVASIMLLMTFLNFGAKYVGGSYNFIFEINTSYTSFLSIIPLTWLVSVILLNKTKKETFAKMPSYIICSVAAMGFILYFIWTGGNLIDNLLALMVVILAVYPFIIATLTIEGRVYNRVFATVFTSILIALTLIGGILIGIILKEFMSLIFFFPLMYVELLLIVLCFRLERIKKNKTESGEEYSTIV